eukprot:3264527-Pyramimonas_sp.AAC.1
MMPPQHCGKEGGGGGGGGSGGGGDGGEQIQEPRQKKRRQQRGGRFKTWQNAKHAAGRQGWPAQFLAENPDPRKRIWMRRS